MSLNIFYTKLSSTASDVVQEVVEMFSPAATRHASEESKVQTGNWVRAGSLVVTLVCGAGGIYYFSHIFLDTIKCVVLTTLAYLSYQMARATLEMNKKKPSSIDVNKALGGEGAALHRILTGLDLKEAIARTLGFGDSNKANNNQNN